MNEGYVLSIKRSARHASGPVGEWVQAEGPRRTFETKELARRWAREVSGPRSAVWVQDAAPTDPTGADGYLVAGERRGRPTLTGEQAQLHAVHSVQPDRTTLNGTERRPR